VEILATLQCEDRSGIVNALTSAVLEIHGNILESQQFTDSITNTFVMRTRFEISGRLADAKNSLSARLSQFNPTLHVRDANQAKRALILVTKASHCLRDLLYLRDLEEMPADFPVVVGNHQDLKPLVESHQISVEVSQIASSTSITLFFLVSKAPAPITKPMTKV
jgi:formyltetrahydrofolate deformylase